jgi:hypothetical protein
MTPKPLVLSVPHAGTRTVQKILNCEHAHVYVRDHPDWPFFAKRIRFLRLVVPLRDPRAVWRSWVKRWNAKQGEVELHLFQPQWEHLLAFHEEYKLFYLPVDHVSRDERLQVLAEYLDRPLHANWDDHSGHMDAPETTDHEEPDWDWIYKLPMVSRFYTKD